MFAITVRFDVKPGHEGEFFERVRRQAADSLDREPGCTLFEVCRNPTNVADVFLYEVYTDEAAFAAHLTTSHFLAFDADVKTWVHDKVIEKWDRP